jgi:glycosyltransferase involved in cell wall biosynthesis
MYNYLITIIIPTYKPQGYIEACLQSINNQIFNKNEYEVIVILNGEKEPYYSYINKIILQYSFNYKIFYTEIKGVSNARNIGIEQSKGKYLAFIDDDDIVSENYLKGLYDISINDKLPLSYAVSFINDKLNVINSRLTNIYEKMINKKITLLNVRIYLNFVTRKIIPREIIGNIRFDYRFQNGEDALFMFEILNNNIELQFTDKTVVYYRRVRNDSLHFRKVDLIYKVNNKISLIIALISIYIKSPSKYNFIFFITRIFAFLKSIFI